MDRASCHPCGALGITAGASAPERLVQEVVERLKELGLESIEEMKGTDESVVFPLPDVRDFTALRAG